MRKLILLFILISSFAFGQDENFIINNNEVYWQKIYDYDESFDNLKEIIKNRNNIKIVKEEENSLSGEIFDVTMLYKDAGFSYMGTPIILNETNKYNGLFKIDFKEGRYRVTLRNVKSQGMNTTMYGGGIGLSSNLSTTMETLTLNRKGEKRKNFYKVNGLILDTTFSKIFDFSKFKTSEKEDNW